MVLTLLNMCISKQSIEFWLRAAAQQHSLGCGLESNPEPWPLTHFRGLQNAGLLVAHRTLYRFWSKGARSENSAKQKNGLIVSKFSESKDRYPVDLISKWGWVKTLVPSEPQNSW